MPDVLRPDDSGHRPEGHGDAELIGGLEPDQLTANALRPFPRMRLSRGARWGLWGLRVVVLLTAAAAAYVFVLNVVHGG